MCADVQSATGVGTTLTRAALKFVHVRRNDRHQESKGCATPPVSTNVRRKSFGRVRMQPESQELET